MKRYAVPTLLVLLSGCAHYDARPIDPETNLAAFEARSLDHGGLAAFMEKIRPDADVSNGWNAAGLTLAAFYYRAVGTIPCRELCFAAVAAFCLNLVPAPFPYLG